MREGGLREGSCERVGEWVERGGERGGRGGGLIVRRGCVDNDERAGCVDSVACHT